jgi:5-methylthioadenosine/S-adenosylhomocysteine deaminase
MSVKGGILPTILLRNPVIVTMDAQRRVLHGKSILIQGGRIIRVAQEKSLQSTFESASCQVIDCSNLIAVPGLINGHTHVAMSVFKGLGHVDARHIYRQVFPIERRLTAKDVHEFAQIGILEMVRGGTTCFVDHYYFISEVARAAKKIGVRGVLGHTLMDVQGPHRGPAEFNRALDFAEEFSADELIAPCFAPHATETVSPGYLREILREAGKRNALVHMHVAQTKSEYEHALRKHKKTPVAYLRDMGAFQSKFLGAHCIYLTKADMGILARNNASAVVTPSSEIVFEKLPRIREMMLSGVNLALGTDCVATADLMSPLHEMKKAFYCLAQADGPRRQAPALRILEMFTINAAKAVGLGAEIGSIEESKRADILLLDSAAANNIPSYDVVSSVVLCSLESMVDTVMVNGKIIFAKNRFTRVDEVEILRAVAQRSKQVFKKSPAPGGR